MVPQSHSWVYISPREGRSVCQRDICTPMCTAARATKWKEASTHHVRTESLVTKHHGILCGNYKEWTPATWDNVVRTREHCVKWNKAGTERQELHDLTQMWTAKCSSHRVWGQNSGHQGGEAGSWKGGAMLGQWWWLITVRRKRIWGSDVNYVPHSKSWKKGFWIFF